MPKKSPAKNKTGKSKKLSRSANAPRKLKSPTYKSFRLTKRIKQPVKLTSSINIFKSALKTLKTNWKLFLVITLIYGFLTVILVRGIGGALNLNELKTALQNGFSGSFSNLFTGLTLFSYLISSAGASVNPAGGVYQSILIVITSLVVIWALRQVQAGNKISAKDAFYQGTFPLIPFILVLLVIGLQLLPLAMGSWLYSTVVTYSIAVTELEKFLWAVLALLLALLSIYMICSSVFALYIVTLPNMTPMKALRSARQLVLYRRWAVFRKVIFLPISLLIIGAIIMIPLIIFVTPLAEWVFFILSMLTLVVVHTYMYRLYRELL